MLPRPKKKTKIRQIFKTAKVINLKLIFSPFSSLPVPSIIWKKKSEKSVLSVIIHTTKNDRANVVARADSVTPTAQKSCLLKAVLFLLGWYSTSTISDVE